MEIRKIKASEIKPAAYNPKQILKSGDKEYESLKKSILNFGYVDPVIWNSRSGNLVGGHLRFQVLLEQGVQEIEASVVDLDETKERALNLALNRIHGPFDQEKLAALLEELTRVPDFDMGLTGFEMPEISKIFDIYLKPKDEDPIEEAESIVNPITQKGDLILLGQHRLLCGDSANKADIAKLLSDRKADLVFTDPPYNVDYSAQNRPVSARAQAKSGAQWRKICNDHLSQGEYEAWLRQVFANVDPYMAPGSAFYIFNGHRQFGPMHQMLLELEFHISCVITWAKQSFAPGYGDYNQQTEFCLYGWKEHNGAHNWYGPKNESTLWQVDRELAGTTEHPTQKPIALVERAIRNSSKRGDIVLDMFLGSGTTLIAAERLGRACYGMELDQRYCDVIVRRYINYVGKDKVSEEIRERYLKEDF